MTDVEDNQQNHFIEGKDEKGKRWPQFLAASSANLANFMAGCVIAWTSPSIPKLKEDDSPVKITPTQENWISSLAPLAAVFGPFIAGFLASKIGRKKGLLLAAVPGLTSWICLAAAESIGVIYFGRIMAGLSAGWIFTVVPMYCGEIADDSNRGAIGSLMQVLICFGILFDYCIGPYVPYMWLSIACAVIPVAFVISFFWMPESPYYLFDKGDTEAGKKALKWLRGKSADGILQDVKTIQADVENAQSQSGGIKDLFATKGTIKAFVLCLGLMAVQQFSGINAVLFNAQNIFDRAGSSLSGDVCTIITGVVMIVASGLTPFIVDRLGRKPLLLTSAIGMAASLTVLGVCFYLDKHGTDTSSFAFLPVLSVICYIIVYCLGFGPLPWAILGEMFPANIKSLASTLTASFCWLLSFLVTRFFNDLNDAVGDHFTFWIFAICCAIAIPFVFFVLPETKGKSLSEIQEILNRIPETMPNLVVYTVCANWFTPCV